MAVDPTQTGQPEQTKEGGIVNWLRDSYNGLFKIMIQPQLPSMRTMMIMAACFIFGLIWAYVINPVTFYDAAPNQLGDNSQDVWIKLVAGAGTEIRVYTPDEVSQLLDLVEAPAQKVQELIDIEQARPDTRNLLPALQQIQPMAQAVDGTDSPSSGNIIIEIIFFILAVVIFLVLANIFAALWGLLIGGLVSDAVRAVRPKTEAQKQMAAERAAIRRQRELEEEMKKTMAAEAAASELGPAVMQRVSIYTKGRGYDDSFAIEDENDMFLGETGATIAKVVGDSQELAAVEVWLFDKEDFVRTITKIFASPHAYSDPAIRSELDPKVENPDTDIIMIQPGATLSLQSKTLLVQAKIADVVPGNIAGLPPNSHYQEMRIQMQAWQKEEPVTATATAVVTPARSASSGLPDLSSYEVGPPPDLPGTSTATQYGYNPAPTQPSSPAEYTPAPSGLPDLSSYEIGPPPDLPETDDEDDPFAGTADFTPLG